METDDKKLMEILSREIFPVLSAKLAEYFNLIEIEELFGLEEIRLRAAKPLILQKNGSDYFLDSNNKITKAYSKNLIYVSKDEISRTMLMMSNYSLYAIEDELKQGFITIEGGHRVGFVGSVVGDGKGIKVIKNISGLNIRIAREVKGCSDRLVKDVFAEGIKNTLIVSPPGCGKTTLLRDVIRNLSYGNINNNKAGYKICVVDERSEIAGCYLGVPQKDIGIRSDVLDACPKTAGIYLCLRSMSPEIIAVDEIGTDEELEVLKYAMNSGVKIIATAHGNDHLDIIRKKNLNEMLNTGLLEKLVILSRRKGPGTVEKIIDVDQELMIC